MPHQCTDCGRRFDDGSKEMLSGCPSCGGNKFQFLPDGATDDAPEPAETSRDPEPDQPGSTVARTVGSAATAVKDLVGSSDSPPERKLPSEAVADSMGEPTKTVDSTRSSDQRGTDRPTPGQRSEPTRRGSRRQNSTPDASPEGDVSQHGSSTERAQAGTDPREPTVATMAETENSAQASARSEVISPDELPSPSQTDSPVRSRAAEEWSQSVPDSEEPEADPPDETERPDLSELREELNQQFESIKVCEPGQYELNLMELFDREEYIIALQEDGKYTVQVPEHWQE